VCQMSTKVLGAEEFLSPIALAKFMDVVEMFGACLPAWRISEFLATVTADVYAAVGSQRMMESGVRMTVERRARPRMAP
jgi:hypothetical protein